MGLSNWDVKWEKVPFVIPSNKESLTPIVNIKFRNTCLLDILLCINPVYSRNCTTQISWDYFLNLDPSILLRIEIPMSVFTGDESCPTCCLLSRAMQHDDTSLALYCSFTLWNLKIQDSVCDQI